MPICTDLLREYTPDRPLNGSDILWSSFSLTFAFLTRPSSSVHYLQQPSETLISCQIWRCWWWRVDGDSEPTQGLTTWQDVLKWPDSGNQCTEEEYEMRSHQKLPEDSKLERKFITSTKFPL
ncbi:hypothetical protein PABG_05949 [Paracoccidioides brasiliensis Pb03]|nr:hypothetical protein PABG_05949 [Paracoccidioides brasiliensis Pb03]